MRSSLWTKIQQFPLDTPGSPLPFSAKLAKENNWSADFTKLAIEEYRRFLYLCATETAVMTPSKVIDTVWHHHLTYTRNYWDGLCRDTIGKPIHHNPSDGCETDDRKYQEAYVNTQVCYSKHFGAAPPSNIWAASQEPTVAKSNFALLPSYKAVAILLLLLSVAYYLKTDTPDFLIAADFGVFIVIFIIIAILCAILGKGGKGGGGSISGSGSCDSDSSCGSSCGGGCGGD